MKKNLLFLMALSMCLLFTACSKDDEGSEGTGSKTETSVNTDTGDGTGDGTDIDDGTETDAGVSITDIVINENGKASNGSMFSAVDDKNYYLDYIKYSVEEGHLAVSGYDKTGFNGEAKIVSSITYKGNHYEVLSINNNVFKNCEKLTSLTLPNSVTSIGSSAFEGCTSLTSLTIPANVTSSGKNAFGECSGLTSIAVDKNNSVYDSRENCNAIIETATNSMIFECSITVVPEGVSSSSKMVLSGEWEGYWGMYYTDTEGKQYDSYQSSVVFYPDEKYDTKGQGYQIDWYRREDGAPYEKTFYSFT